MTRPILEYHRVDRDQISIPQELTPNKKQGHQEHRLHRVRSLVCVFQFAVH
jgi:hypothetical protein